MTGRATPYADGLGSGSGFAGGRCPDSVQPVSKYRTIVADPPWRYDGGFANNPKPGTKGWKPLPYPSMSVWSICDLPVRDLAERNCRLFLWTTNRYLRPAFTVLDAWGFEYAQTLVWHKTGNPSPFGGSVAPIHTEFVLVATRGKPELLERMPASIIAANVGDHSAKPDAFLDTVERISPAPRIELFARRQRLGWDTWGNEALSHVDLGGHIQDSDDPQSLSGSQSG